jgi:hypothetical protein
MAFIDHSQAFLAHAAGVLDYIPEFLEILGSRANSSHRVPRRSAEALLLNTENT